MNNLLSDLPRISYRVFCEPWAVLPSAHASLVETLESHRARGGDLRNEEAAVRLQITERESVAKQEGYVNRITTFDKQSRLAMIAVEGIIGKKLGLLDTLCGGVDLQEVEDGLEKLATLKPVAVQLYLDTPGGTITGLAEATAVIEEFSAKVAPVHAYSDIKCCSAGEWLSSGAGSRSFAGSALRGSIGVYNAMFDQSRRYEEIGVHVHLASSGPLKGAGFPGTRPSERQLEAMAAEVGRLAQEFFRQMNRRQAESGRPALSREIHFHGGAFRAGSPAGAAMGDKIHSSRGAHIQWLARQYVRR